MNNRMNFLLYGTKPEIAFHIYLHGVYYIFQHYFIILLVFRFDFTVLSSMTKGFITISKFISAKSRKVIFQHFMLYLLITKSLIIFHKKLNLYGSKLNNETYLCII